jgi:hypothetical protein
VTGLRTFLGRYAAATLIVAVCLLPVGLAMYRFEPTMMWVGSTDLEVVFEVKDASSNKPVSGAIVDIASEGFLYGDHEPHEFSLITDADGIATYGCVHNMCYGTKGPGIDTFNAHMPQWFFSVGAPGYNSTEQSWLDSLKPRPHAKRSGPHRSKLVVAIALYNNAD